MTVAGTAGAIAVDCAMLGLKTRAVTTVGTDDRGDFLLAKLRRFGVDCALVRRTANAPTSATILPVRPNRERPALHVPGTAAVFTVAEDDLASALDARAVHVGGTGLLEAFDGEPTPRLLKRTKELGCITTFDLIQANPETIALVEPLLSYIDYFVPSIDEAREMAGVSSPDAVAAFFRRKGVRNCLLTLRGARLFNAVE